MNGSLGRGFTLIELLVVIAIIGILASVVLASLSSGRDKSKDAAIKSQMENMRKQAAIFYTNNGAYVRSGGVSGGNDSYPECRANFTGTIFDAAITDGLIDMMDAVRQNSSDAGTRVFCGVYTESWAFAAPLYNPVGSTTGWCVDSSGKAQTVSFAFNAAGNHLVSGGVARCP